MQDEPILTEKDRLLWKMWHRTSLIHARLCRFRHMVDSAKWIIEEAITATDNSMVIMLSGGKDSVAMTHLVNIDMKLGLPVVSHKDDLDYPGGEEYVRQLGTDWNLDLTVLKPVMSLAEFISGNAENGTLRHDDDIHGRTAILSKSAFYELVDEATADYSGVMIGLRADESRGRRMNRITRGTIYRKKSGQLVCTPIADWSGLDVMAYMAINEIDPLPVYRCIAFPRPTEPWRVREGWWLPGKHGRHGMVAWLRHYYPSLYQRLCGWWPAASMMA